MFNNETMAIRTFFLNLPLRIKLMLLLTLIPVLVLSAYLVVVVYIIETDKLGYVLESSANLSKSLGFQTKSEITGVLAKLEPLIQDFINNKKWGSSSQKIFQKEKELLVLALFSTDTKNFSKPEMILEKSLGHWATLSNLALFSAQHFDEVLTRKRVVKNIAGSQNLVLFEKIEAPEQKQSYLLVSVIWAKDLASLFETKKDFKMFLIDDKSQILFGPENSKNEPLSKVLPESFFAKVFKNKQFDGAEIVRGTKDYDWMVSYSIVNFGNLFVVTMIEKKLALTAVTQLLFKSIIFFGLLLSLAFVVSLFSSKYLTSRLSALLNATLQIAKGNFDVKIESQSKDEVGVLAQNFNSMSEEISRLMQEYVEKARMEGELKTAQIVQSTLFPENYFKYKHIEIMGHYEPATECGGDWWSYSLIGNKLYLWIGDATGHGAPAALVTSAARSAASIIENLQLEPCEALTQMSRAIYDVAHGKIMMTFFMGIFDLNTNVLTYSLASHEAPLLVNKINKTEFKKKDLVIVNENNNPRLGEKRDCLFEESQLQLAPGDQILFYTDGLTDIQNPKNELLGERKFLKMYFEVLPQPGQQNLVHELNNKLADYRQGAPLMDDVTYFVFSVLPS
jgi:sigma-B regulation protein RsbU (phosphoserine phosphatase)